MNDGEVAAYLAGVDIGRNAAVIVVDHGTVDLWPDEAGDPEPPEACKGMPPERFRYWLLRGVGDAFKS